MPEALDTQTIATLRDGEAVDAVFACTRKERLRTRTGDPYLAVELRDASGSVQARAFRDADLLAGTFESGDLVRVKGRVERFRAELQVALSRVERVQLSDGEAGRFLPVSRRDIDELEGFFEHLAREVYDPSLRVLLESILADRALRAELRRAPCSLPGSSGPAGAGGTGSSRAGARGGRAGAHHAFLGGLLEHSVAVAQLAIDLCAVHPRLDRDLLVCAALLHDIGKTREYEYGADISLSEQGRMLGHVELGLRVIAEHAPRSLGGARRLALEHCILAHHGGGGAAVATGQRAASAEALALQRLNALDAGVKGAFEHGLG